MIEACSDVFVFFLFKQKTAYELRISDWSSDVCSSDLFESNKNRFYLAFESDVGGQALFERLSRTGKIATLEEMPKLLQAALFGLKIDLLPVPPEELPQKTPNTTYFLVDTRHPFWQMIRNNRNIAVSCDLPADETVIKLYPVGADE